MLFTVALSMNRKKRWQWGQTSLLLDQKFALDPSVLKFTHVRASDSLVALMLAKTLIMGSPPGKWVDPKHYETVEKPAGRGAIYDRKQFIEALCRCKGNQLKTAKYLGVNRKTVWRWIRKYDLGEELSQWKRGT